MTKPVETLDDATLAQIEAEIANRNDATAMESACGEYNCSCHDRLPALCATVRVLQAEIVDYEQTDLVPRSRYNAVDAEAREAREHTKQLAHRASAEIESLQSQLEQVTKERDELQRRLSDVVTEHI